MEVSSSRADNGKRIGLVLSGGGMRALLFHLGVLRWLAERGLWDRVEAVSSVSGGSWCVGCVLGHAGGKWPSAEDFLASVLPAIRKTLTERSMLMDLIGAALRSPWQLLTGRYRLFVTVFRTSWGLEQTFDALPSVPSFHINATPLETGKRWAFTQRKMGDYLYGYAAPTSVPIALAVAASSGFPFLVGAVRFDTRPFDWADGPYARGRSEAARSKHRTLHLWDGGVYENTGIEPFFKNGRLRNGLEFLIVADAAEPFETQRATWWLSSALRLLFIAMEQVRSLRARQVVQMFSSENNGFYAKIGKSPWQHLEELKAHLKPWFDGAMSSYACDVLSRYEIFPHLVPPDAFDAMNRHGWQTCETIYGALFEHSRRMPRQYADDPVGVAATE